MFQRRRCRQAPKARKQEVHHQTLWRNPIVGGQNSAATLRSAISQKCVLIPPPPTLKVVDGENGGPRQAVRELVSVKSDGARLAIAGGVGIHLLERRLSSKRVEGAGDSTGDRERGRVDRAVGLGRDIGRRISTQPTYAFYTLTTAWP